jgi:hypothetical protein
MAKTKKDTSIIDNPENYKNWGRNPTVTPGMTPDEYSDLLWEEVTLPALKKDRLKEKKSVKRAQNGLNVARNRASGKDPARKAGR